MIVLFLVVVGVVSYFHLDVDKHPDVELPLIQVRTFLPGASPEELEVSITQILEEAVNTVEGLAELRSTSGQGTAGVFPTFNLDRNIETAIQDVRDRVPQLFACCLRTRIPRRLQRATATRIPRFPLR